MVLLSLHDPAATEVEVAGVKASRLARACQFGFPVLPGAVVPIKAGLDAIRAGREAIDRGEPAGARRAIAGRPLEPGLVWELSQLEGLTEPLVVRSSSSLDDNGAWSGAFASLAGVARVDLPTAIRSCWASAFGPANLQRLKEACLTPAAVGLAVLIQPELACQAGGWARFADDIVEVAAVAGAPGPLLSGHSRGAHAQVRSDGGCEMGDEDLPIGPEVLEALAALARRAWAELRADRIEWGVADGTLQVFQLSRLGGAQAPPGSEGRPRRRVRTALPAPASSALKRFASIMVTRTGPLADQLVAPWAAAGPSTSAALPPPDHPSDGGEPARLFDQVQELAARLSRTVSEQCGCSPEELLQALAHADSELATRLGRVSVTPEAPIWLLAALDRVASALVATGRLGSPDQLWLQTPVWVRDALSCDDLRPATSALPGDRWSDLIFSVTASAGVHARGSPASPGRVVGRAILAPNAAAVGLLAHNSVLVARQPVPALAPALWRVGGLVSEVGDPAAHLCEVARTLHVPAVVSVRLAAHSSATQALCLHRRAVLAVDGDSGDVWAWAGQMAV